MNIAEMTVNDYDEVVSLWREVEGIGLHDDVDSKDGIAAYLERNAGLSFVARQDGGLVGAVLCGHDGRRGYLHHLAVVAPHRRRGVGWALVDRVLDKLRSIGISKCHVLVFDDNAAARDFWSRIGWSERTDLTIMSKSTDI